MRSAAQYASVRMVQAITESTNARCLLSRYPVSCALADRNFTRLNIPSATRSCMPIRWIWWSWTRYALDALSLYYAVLSSPRLATVFLFQGGQWCVAALCVPALRLSLALLERSFCDVDRAAFEPLLGCWRADRCCLGLNEMVLEHCCFAAWRSKLALERAGRRCCAL